MKAITGVFTSPTDATRAARQLQEQLVPQERITVLFPGKADHGQFIPVTGTEQPGMGKAMGGVVGGATGLAAGWEIGMVLTAAIPGVGPVIAIGVLGAMVLGMAGVGVGTAIGKKAEDATTEGLPEDELFVYEDALRKGRSVVITLAQDEGTASAVQALLEKEGAETVDVAREKWWIGLRSAEREHYSGVGGNFDQDEKFYRLGFQAALHARFRGKEYDQVLGEMDKDLEELKQRYPEVKAEEPFRRGFERGNAYNESLRGKEELLRAS